MKFERIHLDAKPGDSFQYRDICIKKNSDLGECQTCKDYTRWRDNRTQEYVCSQECGDRFWGTSRGFNEEFAKKEILQADKAKGIWKDIIVVVHDQLEYFKPCIDSLREHTRNFNLYIWDNASGEETQQYLKELEKEYTSLKDPDWTLTVRRSDVNLGFVQPNNDLAFLGKGEYIVLLNSDTIVFDKWDSAMIAFLLENPDVAQVGYAGGLLGSDGIGSDVNRGYKADYIPGWCFCISRKTYEKHGLFDGLNLKFAYFEDSDLSLRLKESGNEIYALHSALVYHYQNKTMNKVQQEDKSLESQQSFMANKEYFQKKWGKYLDEDREALKLEQKEVKNESFAGKLVRSNS